MGKKRKNTPTYNTKSSRAGESLFLFYVQELIYKYPAQRYSTLVKEEISILPVHSHQGKIQRFPKKKLLILNFINWRNLALTPINPIVIFLHFDPHYSQIGQYFASLSSFFNGGGRGLIPCAPPPHQPPIYIYIFFSDIFPLKTGMK